MCHHQHQELVLVWREHHCHLLSAKEEDWNKVSIPFGSAGASALQGITIRKVLVLISTELTFADLC